MARGLLLAFSKPTNESQERAYNHWYDSTHIPEALELPGFVGARRFKLSLSQPMPGLPLDSHLPYLAVYQIESEDPTRSAMELAQAAAHFTLTDAIDASASYALLHRGSEPLDLCRSVPEWRESEEE